MPRRMLNERRRTRMAKSLATREKASLAPLIVDQPSRCLAHLLGSLLPLGNTRPEGAPPRAGLAQRWATACVFFPGSRHSLAATCGEASSLQAEERVWP